MSKFVFCNLQPPDCVTLGIKLVSFAVYMPCFVESVSITWQSSSPSWPVHLAPDVAQLSFYTWCKFSAGGSALPAALTNASSPLFLTYSPKWSFNLLCQENTHLCYSISALFIFSSVCYDASLAISGFEPLLHVLITRHLILHFAYVMLALTSFTTQSTVSLLT